MGLSGRRGSSLPPGGATGEALVKASGTTGDVVWGTVLSVVTAAQVHAVGRWEPITHDPGSGPEIVFDGSDVVVQFVETP